MATFGCLTSRKPIILLNSCLWRCPTYISMAVPLERSYNSWQQNALEEVITSKQSDRTSFFEEAFTLPTFIDYIMNALLRCREQGDAVYALRLHVLVCGSGVECCPLIAAELFTLLMDYRSMNHFQQILGQLILHDTNMWNSLIMTCIKYERFQLSLYIYEEMHEHFSTCLPGRTFVALLKSCVILGDIKSGEKIHDHLSTNNLLENNAFVCCAIIDMYAKLGDLVKAREVFDTLYIKKVAAVWNSLIAGYVEQGHEEEALDCFYKMIQANVPPDIITYICCLKACINLGTYSKGEELHVEIVSKGWEGDLILGSTLVDMYAKFNMLMEAKVLLMSLRIRNVVTWNSLITGYVDSAQYDEMQKCLEHMQLEGILPSSVTYIYRLKTCKSIEHIDELYSEIVKKGFLGADIVLGSTIVDMYANIGSLTRMQDVFDRLVGQNVVSWNALIAGYVEYGYADKALLCIQQMQYNGFFPDSVTHVLALKACSSTGDATKGEKIHLNIAKVGLENDLLLVSTLIDMYANCGLIEEAHVTLQGIHGPNIVSWTSLIQGCVDLGYSEKALYYFEEMQQRYVSPVAITFICLLRACAAIGAAMKGLEIHALATKKGIESDSSLVASLVEMYSRCGMLSETWTVFTNIPVQQTICRAAVIKGFVECKHSEEAVEVFRNMRIKGIFLESVIFAYTLKACSNVEAIRMGIEIHMEITKAGLENEVIIGNALVDFYVKHDFLLAAEYTFRNIPFRDATSWNVLLSGYLDFGLSEEALKCFEKMQQAGVPPDSVALIYGLCACGNMGLISRGKELHAYITKSGRENEVPIGNTLVDLYAKCGTFISTKYIFDRLQSRSLVSWNALLVAYAQVGRSRDVFELFNSMVKEGFFPDLVSFLCVFNVCSHSGLVVEGEMYFEAMLCSYNLVPELTHYSCIVDLYGRAGHIYAAVEVIEKMPLHPGFVIWQTVLSACRRWGYVELGCHAFENILCFNENDAAVYICMHNMFIDCGMPNQLDCLKEGPNNESFNEV